MKLTITDAVQWFHIIENTKDQIINWFNSNRIFCKYYEDDIKEDLFNDCCKHINNTHCCIATCPLGKQHV